ncbi:hypothetical protein I6F14_14770 [Bradyrhizobium sp. IC3069]|uniref:Uncharacterized protein n=1 Tax=Bradyrhizobium yuanmingense TaxID=108015 RepID=A0A1C3TWF6_9BRAD|nr:MULTISPECIES: hypothetical protein [Bradyrhizobium]MCA1359599.1 hypothetical protein [Bradyrhizobium sp. IC4059]MCA1519249.1 hypothetical protein [Bradyrhizobium sp. IC3069]MCA1548543.1 hypothetical protein [Bradyrhizobium sp. BRP19]TWI30740.1 hypothetical protein IQ15_01636 [Bradyrhizobium yuanmingense]UWU86962.1 hypothetical protein N2605_11125 [Bradyrhizobium sp. CB1024]
MAESLNFDDAPAGTAPAGSEISGLLSMAGPMESQPAIQKLRAILPPQEPIAHAREWAKSHRPRY